MYYTFVMFNARHFQKCETVKGNLVMSGLVPSCQFGQKYLDGLFW